MQIPIECIKLVTFDTKSASLFYSNKSKILLKGNSAKVQHNGDCQKLSWSGFSRYSLATLAWDKPLINQNNVSYVVIWLKLSRKMYANKVRDLFIRIRKTDTEE